MEIRIGHKTAGDGRPCFIIGEVGQAHDGSLGFAHSFIDAIADAGADAVKFQTHIPEAESTAEETFRVKVFPQDATRPDYWRRTRFTEPQWAELKSHADERGLVFLSSPFSIQAAEMLLRIGVKGWKIASGETNNLEMLRSMMGSGLPFLVSTGMSYMREVDATVALLREHNAPFILYQCTNRYPCPPEHLGLNLISEYRERYGCPVGLSDHSGRVCAGVAAHAMGACSLEVHVTFHRAMFGPDVPASLTVEELAQLVGDIRFLETARAHPVEKDAETKSLETVRNLFTKSLVPAKDIPAGTAIEADHLVSKKPGTGIPANERDKVIGKRAGRLLKKDELIHWCDLKDE